jgi:hypothetical protein
MKWPTNCKTQPPMKSASAQRQLKKKSGSETTMAGMPTECVSLFSGCLCFALYSSMKDAGMASS